MCVCSTGSRSVQKFLSSRVPCVRAAEFSHYAGRCWTCCGRGTLDLLTLFWTRRICCSWAFGGAPRQFAASLVVLFDHCTQVTGVCVVCDKKKFASIGPNQCQSFRTALTRMDFPGLLLNRRFGKGPHRRSTTVFRECFHQHVKLVELSTIVSLLRILRHVRSSSPRSSVPTSQVLQAKVVYSKR